MCYRLRTLLIVLAIVVVVLTLPAPLKAQYATSKVEHDWTVSVSVGGHRYGLQQVIHLPMSYRTTTIHFGRVSVQSKLNVGQVIGFVAIATLVIGMAVAIAVSRRRA